MKKLSKFQLFQCSFLAINSYNTTGLRNSFYYYHDFLDNIEIALHGMPNHNFLLEVPKIKFSWKDVADKNSIK